MLELIFRNISRGQNLSSDLEILMFSFLRAQLSEKTFSNLSFTRNSSHLYGLH